MAQAQQDMEDSDDDGALARVPNVDQHHEVDDEDDDNVDDDDDELLAEQLDIQHRPVVRMERGQIIYNHGDDVHNRNEDPIMDDVGPNGDSPAASDTSDDDDDDFDPDALADAVEPSEPDSDVNHSDAEEDGDEVELDDERDDERNQAAAREAALLAAKSGELPPFMEIRADEDLRSKFSVGCRSQQSPCDQ